MREIVADRTKVDRQASKSARERIDHHISSSNIPLQLRIRVLDRDHERDEVLRGIHGKVVHNESDVFPLDCPRLRVRVGREPCEGETVIFGWYDHRVDAVDNFIRTKRRWSANVCDSGPVQVPPSDAQLQEPLQPLGS